MSLQRRLVGDSRTATVQTVAVAVSGFLVLFLAQIDPVAAVLDSLGGGVGIGNLIVVVPAVVLVLAGYHASRHDGLLVCVAVAHFVSLAWVIPMLVWGTPGFETDPGRLLGVYVSWSLLVGSVGYVLGRLVAVAVDGPFAVGSG